MGSIENQNTVKHGGAGAMDRISKGKPFIGIAYEAQKEVEAELAESGLGAMMERDAIRLQTATELYWNAVQKAAEDGDIAKLDRYIARLGWVAGASIRAWEAVHRMQSKKKGGDVIDLLSGGNND